MLMVDPKYNPYTTERKSTRIVLLSIINHQILNLTSFIQIPTLRSHGRRVASQKVEGQPGLQSKPLSRQQKALLGCGQAAHIQEHTRILMETVERSIWKRKDVIS